MDTRAARRAAEKAARDLINNRATLIGELGVAQAERTQLDADVTAAADQGRQLVAAAQSDAARLLERAQTAVRHAEQRYTDVYNSATKAGWAPADLTALSFRPTGTTNPRRRRTQAIAEQALDEQTSRTAPSTASSSSESTVRRDLPQQHNYPDEAAVTSPPA